MGQDTRRKRDFSLPKREIGRAGGVNAGFQQSSADTATKARWRGGRPSAVPLGLLFCRGFRTGCQTSFAGMASPSARPGAHLPGMRKGAPCSLPAGSSANSPVRSRRNRDAAAWPGRFPALRGSVWRGHKSGTSYDTQKQAQRASRPAARA